MKTSFRVATVMLILLFALSSIGPASAIGASLQLYQGGDSPDGLPANQATYTVFYDRYFTFTYSGEPVCLSSQDGQCTSPAIDDEAIITVNGVVFDYLSYTHDFGPVDFTPYLHSGSNQIRVQLVDRMGPSRGGSALWLVSGNASIPVAQIAVQRDGDFFSPDGKGGIISIEGQPRANVPFTVTVKKDGAPVVAELHQLQPFNAYGGITDSNGISKGSVAISIPPRDGDVKVQYNATVDGITVTSDSTLLYHVTTLYASQENLTVDDVNSWGGNLFIGYTLQVSIPSPEIPGWKGSDSIIDILRTLLQVGVAYLEYNPQVGDTCSIMVYEFSAPNMTTAYLYREAALRNGNVVMERNYFTTDYSKIENTLNPYIFSPTHKGLDFRIASPATLFVTDPNGLSSGAHPDTGLQVFGFPMALSPNGDEPYRSFIPAAPDGRYLVQVVGTGDGSYTFSTYSLTHSGIATPTLSVTGLTHLGYITKFIVDYYEQKTTPVTLAVIGTVDIKPETLNVGSMSGPNSVTAFIELPLGFDVKQIDLRTVRLAGTIPAQLVPTSIGDYNGNGIPDLMVKFDRKLLINYLKSKSLFGDNVALTITGDYSITVQFMATGTITVLKK